MLLPLQAPAGKSKGGEIRHVGSLDAVLGELLLDGGGGPEIVALKRSPPSFISSTTMLFSSLSVSGIHRWKRRALGRNSVTP